MEKIRIITDSASDISQNTYGQITILPMTISFGSEEYQDGVNLTVKEFYEKLIESDQLPTTSLVSPVAFEEAFKKAVENGEKVIAITMSSKLSGTYQSAMIAAENYSDNVFVIDSKSVAMGEQILVLRALQLIESGKSFNEIAAELEKEKENIHLIAVLDTLEYLKKGGRISKTAAFVGGALSIKPVAAIKDGVIEVIGKARGSKNGNNFLIKEIESTSGINFKKPLCLGYSGLSDSLLQKYIEDSKAIWQGNTDSLRVAPIGATIGTHVGPGAIAVAFFAV